MNLLEVLHSLACRLDIKSIKVHILKQLDLIAVVGFYKHTHYRDLLFRPKQIDMK